MKIILSRKGFDSSAGGCASPILDGRLISLPIPDSDSTITYAQVQYKHVGALGDIVHDLTRGRITPAHGAHLDPDLDEHAINRVAGWRPLFGQVDAAQSHLEKTGVDVGDLFLMFGWFRYAQKHDGVVSYVPGKPHLHVLYGWFQIGSVLQLGSGPDRNQFPKWTHYHPHFCGRRGQNNVLYVAADRLIIGATATGLPGAGRLAEFRPELRLTAGGSDKRSVWKLPRWFDPHRHPKALSYHYNLQRWNICADGYLLNSVGRGQEFVFNTNIYPEAEDWVAGLLRSA